MFIVVTGATGKLGRLVVEGLLERGVLADRIVAAGRSTERLADLEGRGVRLSRIDFAEPGSLRAAFQGAERVLLVSGSEVGQRTQQHQNAIDAAKIVGVGLLAYTSVANADTTSLLLAAEHQATERALDRSGVPFVLLRHGWYMENYTERLDTTLAHGALIGSAGDGRISAATRADYAGAAAAVLTSDGHHGAVYELGGDESFTMAELAEEISRQAGKEIAYHDLPVEEYVRVLVEAGLPEPAARLYADSDRGVAQGDLFIDTGDLSRLAGRPTTAMRDAVAAALPARSSVKDR